MIFYAYIYIIIYIQVLSLSQVFDPAIHFHYFRV